MQKLRRFLPKTLSVRMMLIFFFAAFIPFVFVSMMTLTRVSDAMEEDAETRLSQMIHLVGDNLDSRIHALTDMTERMYLYRTNSGGVTVGIEDILTGEGAAGIVHKHLHNGVFHLRKLDPCAIFLKRAVAGIELKGSLDHLKNLGLPLAAYAAVQSVNTGNEFCG